MENSLLNDADGSIPRDEDMKNSSNQADEIKNFIQAFIVFGILYLIHTTITSSIIKLETDREDSVRFLYGVNPSTLRES